MFLCLILLMFSCSKNAGDGPTPKLSDQFVNGELNEVAKKRGLTAKDLIAAAKTYNPSGALDEYLAFFGTGVSGRLAVVGMPSMKILKYVAVFSAEPWQGYAYDDESKAIIGNSSRDEISYSFGDTGTPALSLTKGAHDGRALFMADAANGRMGMVDLAEYETKQIVTHPLFKYSNPDVAVTAETQYIIQTIGSSHKDLTTSGAPAAGATFWKFVEKENGEHKIYFMDPASSFTVAISGGVQSSPAAGKGPSDGLALSVTNGNEPVLNVFNWKKAESLVATAAAKVNGHFVFNEEQGLKNQILIRHKLPAGSHRVSVSGDGQFAIVLNKNANTVQLVDLKSLGQGKFAATNVDVGGVSVDAAFTEKYAYVTTQNPHQVVRIDVGGKTVAARHALDFPVGKIVIPESDAGKTADRYAIVVNHSPYGRFSAVGPQLGLSAHLLDLRGEKLESLYDASIPQSTRLAAVAMSTKVNKPIFRYKIGTDPRSGLISNYKTPSGTEKIIRKDKRVHVYATVIRSHITPDLIEVEQGDTVSIHITSNEQSRDQTHGFTIDSYNVHGSFEPGKTASVTFVADRPGVFPFYCTEFCSALHLEMQGYLLVKPAKPATTELAKAQNNPTMKSFFKYIKGE